MNTGITLSPATFADAAGATEAVVALETALYGLSTFSQPDLEGEWADLELSRDVRTARLGERIVGFSLVRERGERWRTDACVHPAAHGRGVGSRIAADLEERAAADGADRIQNGIIEIDTGARRLLESRGYSPVRVFRELRITLEKPPEPPVWPDGLRIVAFDPKRDARAFHTAHQEAFADSWDFSPRTFEAWSKVNLEDVRFDPSLWCVVRARDEIAAGTICTGATYGGGWVQSLFTRRPWRKQGIGAALLADAFTRLWTHGEREVGLGVDAESATGAFRLYERAGMKPALGWIVYEREL